MAGYCYYAGKGTAVDYNEALKWLQASANQNNANAIYFIGVCLMNGQGVKQDLSKAKAYLEKAKTLGSQEAANLLKQSFKS